MSKEYDVLTFVCRAQGFHNGHSQSIVAAAHRAQSVLVIVGSANRAPNPKNPFPTYDIANTVISKWLKDDNIEKLTGSTIRVIELNDYESDDDWATAVRCATNDLFNATKRKGTKTNLTTAKFGVIGYEKDSSSFYLNLLQTHGFDWVSLPELANGVSATDIRASMYEDGNIRAWENLLPRGSREYIERYLTTPAFERMKQWYFQEKKEKQAWSNAPYPVTYQTADALVISGDQFLVIQRQSTIGYGQWALPGGYVDVPKRELTIDTAIRELQEETNISLPTNALKQCEIEELRTFIQDPNRSGRGRIFSMLHVFDITEFDSNRRITTSNTDEALVSWRLITDGLNAGYHNVYFEDHGSIIEKALQKYIKYKGK